MSVRHPSAEASDLGDSLLEIILAIGIMAIAFTAIIAGMASSIRFSSLHRTQSTAQEIVRGAAEYLADSLPTASGGTAAYVASCDPVTVQAAYAADLTAFATGYTLPDGSKPADPTSATRQYSVSVAAPNYWNGSTFTSTCSTDPGYQRLTITVTSTTDSRVVEQIQVGKRKW